MIFKKKNDELARVLEMCSKHKVKYFKSKKLEILFEGASNMNLESDQIKDSIFLKDPVHHEREQINQIKANQQAKAQHNVY